MLKLLMIGAGGIGGYYAARLLDAGHEVVLTARGSHLSALRENGLMVHYEGRDLFHRPEAFDHQQIISRFHPDDFDVIAIALKATATASVVAELGDWLRRGQTPVLSLQNGVDNEPLLEEAIGADRVIGGLAVRIGGHIVRPGVIEAEGVAQIVMGEWPAASQGESPHKQLLGTLASAFNDSGIPATLSDNIRYELWRKLVINNGVNPLSALTGLDTRTLTQHPEFGKIVYGMMAETVKASKADNVKLLQKDLDEMFELISSFNAIKTSMLVDKEKGRPLELDSIAGAVLRRCRSLGIEAPYTSTVTALLAFEAEKPG
ncbi:ketopantoate reductase family protein [Marinobacter orientalis]|uniref:2-dehydropantoate 2-reductase n=1 Tax=Marinobacter orientalis TaxID=1928859 RepID=A0A7Y0RAL0_9GAMM|nr:2-dehydropantoate 2-reductase [Marinobacter orientalis]NMT63044.1 2-dehydropantoate 2-reductase [Marinobacter orientalis]TGX51705.1 2-dehydropantoate 2-reductase [Marinobacter orientalis]